MIDDLDSYLRDQEPNLQAPQAELERLSEVVRGLVDQQPALELSYEQFLHLDVRIEQTRERILKCNLAIVECLAAITEGASTAQRIRQSEAKKEQHVGCFAFEQQHKLTKGEWLEQTRSTLQGFKKILTLRQVQLTMVLFVLQYRDKSNFQQLYQKNFGEVMQFMIPFEDCQRKMNLPILDDLFKKEGQYLRGYLELLGKLAHFREYLSEPFMEQGPQTEVQLILSTLKIAHSKIKTISEVFPYACTKDINDLFSVTQLHPRWQRLLQQERILYVVLSDQLTLEKSFQDIKENLNVINAAMSIMDRRKNESGGFSVNRRMAIFYQNSINILKCALSKKEAKFQAEVMISQAKDELAKEIWNLPEDRKFREFIAICLPSIAFSQVYYLPRTHRQYFYQRYRKEQGQKPAFKQLQQLGEYQLQLLEKKSYEQSIRVRINCSSKLQFRTDPNIKQRESLVGGFIGSVTKLFKTEEKAPKALILHIHGGGFISMSSFIHQTYTRKWANQLNVPILSVDYGKAPDRPFPQGLYDCFETYMWILHSFSQVFEVQPEKIILVGDSAGGNLVAALTTLLIQWGLPKPAGIVLAYPALNLSLTNYTPSLLTALNDMILPHTFLKVCANAYLGQAHSAQGNPYVSPILTSDATLSQYPPTEIFVGNKDPFHDDCCRFIQRLSDLNKNENRLTIFEEFPHGFLQFDLKLMPNEFSREATKLVQKALDRLIK